MWDIDWNLQNQYYYVCAYYKDKFVYDWLNIISESRVFETWVVNTILLQDWKQSTYCDAENQINYSYFTNLELQRCKNSSPLVKHGLWLIFGVSIPSQFPVPLDRLQQNNTLWRGYSRLEKTCKIKIKWYLPILNKHLEGEIVPSEAVPGVFYM